MDRNRSRSASRLASSSRSVILFSLLDCTSIMIRMLVADDGCHLFRAVVLQRGLARHVGDAHHPAEPGFGAELPGRDQPVRLVESAGHDLDAGAVDAPEA